MNTYDQYTEQLLNSVFENAKQTPASSQNPEEQILNQLLACISSPASFNNTHNEWLLLQQIQQQKDLLERQQLMAALSPALSGLSIAQLNNSNAAATDVPTMSQVNENLSADEKVKKIARVPVHTQPPSSAKPDEKENGMTVDALVKSTAAAALSHHTKPKSKAEKPALQKKRGILQRTWSRRDFKGRAPIPQQRKNLPDAKKNINPHTSVPKQLQQMEVIKGSTFWKPREEKPKGWWKGNRDHKSQGYGQQEVGYQEQGTSDLRNGEYEEEKSDLPSRQTRNVVVVPKKESSISKPKRPMAFKGPTPRKYKSKSCKKIKNEATVTPSKSIATGMPVYLMPRQSMLYPRPMMLPATPQPYMMDTGNGGHYMIPPTSIVDQSYKEAVAEEPRFGRTNRKKSVYNPRAASNDKCIII
ncbi:hypothetical protein BD408DRAFT_411985 [Parasitella parasitica]|nr:hypothetical protein BD408DRAFT_411985 [Parasitella parasitica]